ncbi:MAG TPA: ornithine cyclodeaminase family protein [Gammaproteobacteria bacterium]|nr:ornithine cyclodeaminase family protein [Gammaproteobacteria bacterium]
MLVLDRKQVESLLDTDALIAALAPAMQDLSAGRVSMPGRTVAQVQERRGFLGVMPAYLPKSHTLSCKLVTLFPENRDRPTHQAVVMLFDPATGTPTAMLDGTSITALRTAAGSALATKLLAREDASVLLIVGTGVQALSHARAVSRVRRLKEIRVAGRDAAKAADLARRLEREFGLRVTSHALSQEAFKGAHIVCAATHAAEPVVRGAWLEAGTHVNSVGMNAAGREVDAEAMRGARVYVEYRAAALAPPPSGANDLMGVDVQAEIGEVVAGTRPGRGSPGEITLYKSVGVAVQDAVAAQLVYDAAVKKGRGLEIGF